MSMPHLHLTPRSLPPFGGMEILFSPLIMADMYCWWRWKWQRQPKYWRFLQRWGGKVQQVPAMYSYTLDGKSMIIAHESYRERLRALDSSIAEKTLLATDLIQSNPKVI